MIRATSVVRAAELAGRTLADTITLDRQSRYRRRVSMTTDGGLGFLLDLPEATYLAQGDALALADGRLIGVVAAKEELLEIRADSADRLMQIAWHIGNRHTPAEVTGTTIYIQPDHVLAEMVEGLGATVRQVSRPFEPEGGAYGGHGPLQSGHHHHGHSHSHSHEHHERDHHHRDHGASIPKERVKPAIWKPE
jgi:urease accessory protein